jgi:hypothetical protein
MLLSGKSPIQILAEFKYRYGDIYQFWFGPIRYIVVSGINDVQHIFSNRNIYDQGDIFIDQVSTLFPNGLITLKGELFFLLIKQRPLRRIIPTIGSDRISVGVDHDSIGPSIRFTKSCQILGNDLTTGLGIHLSQS